MKEADRKRAAGGRSAAAKRYLSRAKQLDRKIDFDLKQLEELRAMALSVQSSKTGIRVQSSAGSEAPFAVCITRIGELEQKINAEIDALVAMKEEIRGVIGRIPDVNEQLVLFSRYIGGKSWAEVAEEFKANESTVRRWHDNGLKHVVLPGKPVRKCTA